jgi:hypothetical protein
MVNININNIYKLIYCSKGKLYEINKWDDKQEIKLENQKLIKSDIYFSKLAQLHTGQFLYINNKCQLFVCDSNFKNSREFDIIINNYKIKINAVCQLSNYHILICAENRLYRIESVNTPEITFKLIMNNNFISLKQNSFGDIFTVEAANKFCGNIFKYKLDLLELTSKEPIILKDGPKNTISVANGLPDQSNFLSLFCNEDMVDKIYSFNTNDPINPYFGFCPIGYELNGLLCYKKCRDGYKGVGPVCWKKCDDNQVDVGALCRDKCRDGYNDIAGVCWQFCTKDQIDVGALCRDKCRDGYRDVAGICWKYCTDNQVDVGALCRDKCRDGYRDIAGICWKTDTLLYDRGIGILPSYGSCNKNGLNNVTTYPLTCTGWRKSCTSIPVPFKCRGWSCSAGGTEKVCVDEAVTRNRPGPNCSNDREMHAGLCYKKCRQGYTGNVTMCNLNNASYVPKTVTKDSYVPKTETKGSYVPKTIAKNSYGRGIGIPLNTKKPKKCNCCQDDLEFINPYFVKPIELTLPNDFVLNNFITGFYDSTSFKNNIWYDLSKANNNAVFLKGDIQVVDNYLTGNINSSILFSPSLLQKEYTLFHLCKYNGQNKNRILQGYSNDWLSGFWGNKSGVSYKINTWNTQNKTTQFADNWMLTTDFNDGFRCNGNDLLINLEPNRSNAQLCINDGIHKNESSDWAIACIIAFNKKLTIDEIKVVENWITKKYKSLFTPTFKQDKYSEFNQLTGKTTNNDYSYQYASYNDKNIINSSRLTFPPLQKLNNVNCESDNEFLTYTNNLNDIDSENNINQEIDNLLELNSDDSVLNNKQKLCKNAFEYYNLYPSDNPLTVRGRNIFQNIKNQITNIDELKEISQKYPSFFPNSNTSDGLLKDADELLKNMPLNLGCCLNDKGSNDTKPLNINTRVPLSPYTAKDNSLLKKFNFEKENLTIPPNSCPNVNFAGSNKCNAFVELYCKNVLKVFNDQKLPSEDFIKYAPECACYAPREGVQLKYPSGTPSKCFKPGCENSLNIYMDPTSRNNQCDLTICENIVNLKNINANGDIQANIKLENICGPVINKANEDKVQQDLIQKEIKQKELLEQENLSLQQIINTEYINNSTSIYYYVILVICFIITIIILIYIFSKK